MITTVNVTGYVKLPDNSEASGAVVTFQLSASDYDTAGDTAIPKSKTSVTLGSGGSITAPLWPNDRGTVGTYYFVDVIWTNSDGKPVSARLGTIQPVAAGPNVISDLLAAGSAGFDGIVVSFITQDQYDAVANTLVSAEQMTAAIAAAEDAQAAAEVAEVGAVSAQGLAEGAQSAAEAARDAATTNANVYTSTSAGLAATVVGDQFQVVAGDEVVRFRHDAGPVATEVARYPASSAVLPYLRPASVSEAGVIGAFTALDADGHMRMLAGFYEDGSFESQPVADFMTARMGGGEYTEGDADGWGPLVFYQTDSDGLPFVVAGIRDSGEWYPNGSGGAGEVIYHIPFHGQSNAMADESAPPISTSSTGWGSLKFSRGIATWIYNDNAETPAARADSGFSLIPLVSGAVETRANALADHFKSAMIGASRYTASDTADGLSVLISAASLGGRKLTELGPEDHGASGEAGARSPGGFWPTLLDDVARAKSAAETAGREYRLPFWNYDQGESEGDLKLYINGSALLPSEVIAGYSSRALTMVTEFDAEVQSITGKTRPTPCLITPACYNQLTPTAWMDVCDSTDLAIMVGPRYQMPSALMSEPRGENIHYSPDGHRWIGEMVAKVGARVMSGENWQPLRALYAEKSGSNSIDVAMHVPRPPLVLDTRTWPQVSGWGFQVYSGSVDSKTNRAYPESIDILPDGATVRLTFSAAIPSGAKLLVGAASACPELSGLTVSSVGASTLNGASAYTVTIAGDYTILFGRAISDGAFFLTGDGPSHGIIRDVALVGGNTVLTGEDSELSVDVGNVPFTAGDIVSASLLLPRSNIRDSDNAAALNKFVSGDRAGQYYPLHNWLCQYDGITVEGS